MNILEISGGYIKIPPKKGGALESVIFNISKSMSKLGYDVSILDRKYASNEMQIEYACDVKIIRLSARMFALDKNFFQNSRSIKLFQAFVNGLIFIVAVNKYISFNHRKFDYIHIHFPLCGAFLVNIHRRIQQKLIYTSHVTFNSKNNLNVAGKLTFFLDIYVAKRCNKVIALNSKLGEKFFLNGVKKINVLINSNGVDVEEFNPSNFSIDIINKYGVNGKNIILFVGRIVKIKGVQNLIESINIIKNKDSKSIKNLACLLIGPTALSSISELEYDKVRSLIKKYELEKIIRFTDAIPYEDLVKLYASSDIVVIPSIQEGSPLVLLEGMASKKPIIGTKIAGISEHIVDGWNGFIVDIDDSEQLAEKLIFLLDHPLERQRMGLNSRKYAEESLDWVKISHKIADFI